MERVAVLLGGESVEREVSLMTGAAVADALSDLGRQVVRLDAGPELAADLRRAGITAAFIALHGRWGEDGTVQGLLEIMRIPYTGSGVLASALAMDKVVSKTIFRAAGIPTPDFQLLRPEDSPRDLEIELPVVVKPAAEGSTIGVTVVRDGRSLPEAVAAARQYGSAVLVEKFVAGRELTVGVLDGHPLPIVEIAPETGFYDYQSKYTPGRTQYHCPAPLAVAAATAVARAGAEAYASLGCCGAARTDVILDDAGQPWVLEVNTIPGMTPTSLLPKAAAAAGITFGALVGKILDGASLKA